MLIYKDTFRVSNICSWDGSVVIMLELSIVGSSSIPDREHDCFQIVTTDHFMSAKTLDPLQVYSRPEPN